MMGDYIENNPTVWNEDIGEEGGDGIELNSMLN